MSKITVEEFLVKGLLFVDHDVYEDSDGEVIVVGDGRVSADNANTRMHSDCTRFVISAKALEQKPNRVSVSYEKIEFKTLSEAFAEHERYPLYHRLDEQIVSKLHMPRHLELKTNYEVVKYHELDSLYRKTEITPMQAAKNACAKLDASDYFTFESFCDDDNVPTYDDGVIALCRAAVNAYDGVE